MRIIHSGENYPAALFGGNKSVNGVAVLIDPVAWDMTILQLDVLEGVDQGHYRRVQVQTSFGITCLAYEYVRSTEGTPLIPSGVWA